MAHAQVKCQTSPRRYWIATQGERRAEMKESSKTQTARNNASITKAEHVLQKVPSLGGVEAAAPRT